MPTNDNAPFKFSVADASPATVYKRQKGMSAYGKRLMLSKYAMGATVVTNDAVTVVTT